MYADRNLEKIPLFIAAGKMPQKKVGPKTLRKTRNMHANFQASSYEPELCLERAVWELNIGLPDFFLPRNAQGIRQDLILVEGTQPWGLPPSVPTRHQENKNRWVKAPTFEPKWASVFFFSSCLSFVCFLLLLFLLMMMMTMMIPASFFVHSRCVMVVYKWKFALNKHCFLRNTSPESEDNLKSKEKQRSKETKKSIYNSIPRGLAMRGGPRRLRDWNSSFLRELSLSAFFRDIHPRKVTTCPLKRDHCPNKM